jgi:hypothetical protein
MKDLARFDEFKQHPQIPPSIPAPKSSSKLHTRLSADAIHMQAGKPASGPALTVAEAIEALDNNCARIRILDIRSGRSMELQGDASLIPHLQGLLLRHSQNGSLKLVINQPTKSREVLNSWKEISRYLNRGVRTVQRYHVTLGLPVRRTSGKSRSAVLAFTDELDAWLEARPMQVSTQSSTQQQ